MFGRKLIDRPLHFGVIVGAIFGAVNLIVTWLDPLEDDTPGALLWFYGPMFFLWAVAGFRAARQNGRLLSGVSTGMAVAFATFCVFQILVLLRVNLFLDDLTDRLDWQDMMARFQVSDFDSFRLFVNVDYVEGAPLKIAAATAIGAILGALAGLLGRSIHGRRPPVRTGTRAA